MRIGVLGGTFDPVHNGHLALARAALGQYRLDKVLFIPALIPPHKHSDREITPAPHRYRMVEIAIQEEPLFEISDVELNRRDVSYTVDTLKELHRKYPGSHFFLIVGEDSAGQLSNWKAPDEILKLAKVISARRPGYPSKDAQGSIERVEMPECPVSSSDVRSRLARGDWPGTEVLPEKVENYIRKMKLYGVS